MARKIRVVSRRLVFYFSFHFFLLQSGFDLFVGLQYPNGIPRDVSLLSVLGALIFVGGPGFPVLAELVHGRPRKRLTLYTRLAPAVSFGLVILAQLCFCAARGARVVRSYRSSELPRRAAPVPTVSIFVVVAATWLLLLTGNGTLDQAAFEVVSAFATTGLSLAFTPQLNMPGLVIIMLMMIWGRPGALNIILALARRRPPQPIQYPEESILIG